jgi:hypothetical protein
MMVVGASASLDALVKRKISSLPEIEPKQPRLYSSHYTIISAPIYMHVHVFALVGVAKTKLLHEILAALSSWFSTTNNKSYFEMNKDLSFSSI